MVPVHALPVYFSEAFAGPGATAAPLELVYRTAFFDRALKRVPDRHD
jgi:hypothetical protein